MGVSNLTASVRGHESFSQMGRVISRTAFSQLRHSTLLLLATLVGLAITYVLPVVMTFSNIPVLMALGMSAWAVMTLCYFPVVRFYGLKPQWSLTLPIAVLFYMAATLWSALRFWSSKGGEWKERVQDPAVRATFQSREDMGRH
jgi:hypothetical protein